MGNKYTNAFIFIKDRNIAMVFQSYALYPSMTVKENIIFGLKQAKVSKNKIEEHQLY